MLCRPQFSPRFYPGKLLPRPPSPQTTDPTSQEHPSQQTLLLALKGEEEDKDEKVVMKVTLCIISPLHYSRLLFDLKPGRKHMNIIPLLWVGQRWQRFLPNKERYINRQE